MFSIIIPLYNKAPYIAKAIQSVTAQTYKEFELIVIDDGSTDIAAPQPPKGGGNISYYDIEALIGKKGFLLKQSNSGVSNTRNKGVSLAKFPYIAFLDADDWWESTFLEEMKALMDEFPEAGIYGSSYYKVRNGKFIPANIGVDKGFTKGYINYFEAYSKSLWMPLWTGAVVIPKKIYLEFGGFKPELKLGEDFDLWVRIALKYKVALLNKALSNYNQDVDMDQRGVVHNKIYEPSTHFIFNLDYLAIEEHNNSYLKKTLDLQRIYTLMRYKRANAYPADFKREIHKVNFKNQPFSVRLFYRLPSFLINSYQTMTETLIKIKNRLT